MIKTCGIYAKIPKSLDNMIKLCYTHFTGGEGDWQF